MLPKTIRLILALTVIQTICTSAVLAAKANPTVIYVKDMHCEACAKKIAGKLYGVAGVVSVKTHVKKGIAIVESEANKQASPKALWEAVEAAEFAPIKVAGPMGTYTEKPRR